MKNKTLIVKSVFRSPLDIEVFYNDISENSLYSRLDLENPDDVTDYTLKDITCLQNEIAILNYFMSLGFNLIKDPDSPVKEYPITDHIDLIKSHITFQQFHTNTVR